MKTFLTGAPHCGKSTLINKIISQTNQKVGFVTNEILDSSGRRFGFELVDNNNHKDILAHTDSVSSIRVSRYGVNVDILDEFLKPLFDIQPGQLLYIDEIGQMELYSDQFIKLVKTYLNTTNSFVGTLSSVFDHELITNIKNNPNYKIYEINEENRDSLAQKLITELEIRT